VIVPENRDDEAELNHQDFAALKMSVNFDTYQNFG
jgi:hypothetical protein